MCNCGTNSCGCPTIVIRKGPQGPKGDIGPGAWTVTTVNFAVPAVDSSIPITGVNFAWAGLGEPVYMPGAGTFIVSVVGTTSITITNTGITGNATPGTVIDAGTIVTPGGQEGPAGTDGDPGTDGINCFTVTTSQTTMPSRGSNVFLAVTEGRWATLGGRVEVVGLGNFLVVGAPNQTQINVQNPLDVFDNAAPGTVVASGAKVGLAGAPGHNCFTTLTADFPTGMPAIDASTTTTVLDPQFFAVGATVFMNISGVANYFEIVSVSGNTIGFKNPAAYVNNVAEFTTVPSGTFVVISGVIGPQGPTGTGSPGAAGHTPVWYTGSGSPSGGTGVDGDVYTQTPNSGKIVIWTKASGTWTSMATLVGNRYLGFGAADPNTLSLVANTNDYYWTLVGTIYSYWVYNGSSWVVQFGFNIGGGGGSPTFAQVTTNSAALTGLVAWKKQNVDDLQKTTATQGTHNGTYTFDLTKPLTVLTITDDTVLAYSNTSIDAIWKMEIYNSTGGSLNLTYAAGTWATNSGISEPTSLAAGERVRLTCERLNTQLVITDVIGNIAIIP